MKWSLFCLTSCITVHTVTVSQKSALEAQFIGEAEELSDDLVTMASVRATVNGSAATVYAADIHLIGVLVPAGKSRVVVDLAP